MLPCRSPSTLILVNTGVHMLFSCWASVCDAGPTSNQHCPKYRVNRGATPYSPITARNAEIVSHHVPSNCLEIICHSEIDCIRMPYVTGDLKKHTREQDAFTKVNIFWIETRLAGAMFRRQGCLQKIYAGNISFSRCNGVDELSRGSSPKQSCFLTEGKKFQINKHSTPPPPLPLSYIMMRL